MTNNRWCIVDLLHIISPTDCCRDRLAGFLFWRDRGSLDQAVAVAGTQKTKVDLGAIRRWCEAERHAEAYRELELALAART
jgi:hypothetical protein